MRINSDFTQAVAVTPAERQWIPSPQHGVDRVMLDRVGGEVARATSLVRYAPGTFFPDHEHERGEEILVLDGVFSDASRDYGRGWYIRNPPGSSHQPWSAVGALIFVKLRQQPVHETAPVRIDTRDPARWTERQGRSVCELHVGDCERVSLHRIKANQPVLEHTDGGAELLILDGALDYSAVRHGPGTWIRLPPDSCPLMVAADAGVTVYLKTGHLRELAQQSHGMQP